MLQTVLSCAQKQRYVKDLILIVCSIEVYLIDCFFTIFRYIKVFYMFTGTIWLLSRLCLGIHHSYRKRLRQHVMVTNIIQQS